MKKEKTLHIMTVLISNREIIEAEIKLIPLIHHLYLASHFTVQALQ